MLDVGGDFRRGQMSELALNGDTLLECAELRPGEFLLELGLADEHDLKELLGPGLEVGEQPKVLQRLLAQMLRLVDEERGRPPC